MYEAQPRSSLTNCRKSTARTYHQAVTTPALKRVLPAVAFVALALPAAASAHANLARTDPASGATFARWLFLAGVLAAVGISLYALIVVREAGRRIAITLGVAAVAAAAGAAEETLRVGHEVRYGEAMAAGFFLAAVVAVG